MKIDLLVFPQKIFRFLIILVLTLSLLSITTQIILRFSENNILLQAIAKIFYVDSEGNLPSLYSALSLLSCSILLAAIAFVKKVENKRYVNYWIGLSLIFLFLFWDESVQIHEKLLDTSLPTQILSLFGLERQGVFTFSWIVVAIPLLIVFSLFYFKFFLSLSFRIKRLFLIAMFTFVGGALGMEMVAGLITDTDSLGYNSIPYVLSGAVEELCEMMGIVVFIYALLLQLSQSSEKINVVFLNDTNNNKKEKKSINT